MSTPVESLGKLLVGMPDSYYDREVSPTEEARREKARAEFIARKEAEDLAICKELVKQPDGWWRDFRWWWNNCDDHIRKEEN